MRNRLLRLSTLLVLLFSLLIAESVYAWTPVGQGIDYHKFTLPDPNNVYVSRMLRSNAVATIESSLPQGKLTGARETVRGQSNRLHTAINWWGDEPGQRNNAAVAINGDWIHLSNGMIYGGQVHSKWYARQMYVEYGGAQFAWTNNRLPFIGGSLHQATQSLTITYRSSGTTQTAHGINRQRGDNELILYTPQYDRTTNTNSSGLEVLVEMTQPTSISPLPGMKIGYVREIRPNTGSTPIPFDHIVLSAAGTSIFTLQNNVSIGDEIGISQSVDLKESPSFNWSDTYSSISGGHILVNNGQPVNNSNDPVMASRHPRTAVAYNDTYVYFIVCDGRSTASRGMTGLELSNFIINHLGATNALNLDGGGSSTMVVNGSVVNVPSDGSERAIGNGLMMVNLLPKLQSSTFCPGQYVNTTANSNVRLGPGTNYESLTTVPGGTVGIVQDHSLNGVFAKSYYWWKIDFNGIVGWVAGSLLNAHGNITPSIIQHPENVLSYGEPASFSVKAVGSGCLNYQWYRGQTPLSNGSAFSGVNTPKLTVKSPGLNTAGFYHCVVSNLHGTATSNPAELTYGGVSMVAAAKNKTDGQEVTPLTAIVSGGSDAFTSFIYVQDFSRSSGIRVTNTSGITTGSVVNISGTAGRVGVERCIIASSAGVVSSSSPPKPLVVSSKNLAGADWNPLGIPGAGQVGVPASRGLNNVGLLVTVTGKVMSAQPLIFTVWDGSFWDYTKPPSTPHGVNGVLVSTRNLVNVSSGQFVKVTGVSSLLNTSSGPVPMVLIRWASDIEIIQ